MVNEDFMPLQHSDSVLARMAATVFAGLAQPHRPPGARQQALQGRLVLAQAISSGLHQ